MARRNTSLFEDIFEGLTHCPWWISVIFAAGVYVFLAKIFPTMKFEGLLMPSLVKASPQFAPVFGLLFLMPAPISFFNSRRKGILLKKQKNVDSIKALSWKEFEELVAEAYRQQGYHVSENETLGPDGGVDLVLRKNGNMFLVQCKQWRTAKVGVKVVREMYGLMHAQNANGAILITTGIFTQEARNFADDKTIDLIEGDQVAKLIENSQRKISPRVAATDAPQPAKLYHQESASPVCGKCGAEMVVKVARRGTNAGQKFFGCSNYPKCRNTKAIS